MIRKFYSVFIEDIEFDFEDYDEWSSMDGYYFEISGSFLYGSEKQEQWKQLYEDFCNAAGVHQEFSLKLSVPHLNISGVFTMIQVYFIGYEDKTVFFIRAK